MKKIDVIAIGSDPEVFIRDTKNEIWIPSVGLIGGTKDEPIQVTPEGHALQEDNVMVEFCVPPVRDAESMHNNMSIAINIINKKLQDIDANYQVMVVASADFTDEQLNSEQAQTVGCSPDFNAWFNMQNPIPELPQNVRFAGGHIHISYVDPTEEKNIELVKALDLFLGLPSVLMDIDDRRKEIYGTPGRYRTKSYGVEYRSLSNFWVNDLELTKWVFNQINLAIDYVNENKEVSPFVPVAIDTNNEEQAVSLCEEYGISYIKNIYIEYETRHKN